MIILVGESAAGKSSIEKILNNKYGYKKIISYTTRERRNGEIEGVDYYFVDDIIFERLKRERFFVETSYYNGCFYGIPINQCSKDSVLVATPHTLRQLIKNTDLNIISFYINVPRRDRLIKILLRGDNIDEAYRRSVSDIGQFDGVKDEVNYIVFNDGYVMSTETIARIINSYCC